MTPHPWSPLRESADYLSTGPEDSHMFHLHIEIQVSSASIRELIVIVLEFQNNQWGARGTN